MYVQFLLNEYVMLCYRKRKLTTTVFNSALVITTDQRRVFQFECA